MALGCGSPTLIEPVTYVQTSTPGIKYVIVHPKITGPHATDELATSDYLLLCDARGVDGMRCTIPPEVATERVSHGVPVGHASAPVQLGIGTLTGVSIEQRLATEPAPSTTVPSTTTAPTPPPATSGAKR